MTIRNSFKQMLRTPVKTVLFLVLLSLSAVLLTLGVSLWHIGTAVLDAYEGTFITIGTVQQKQTSMERNSYWNGYQKEYVDFVNPVYGVTLPVSVLDFEGADYILAPEKRPTYSAYHRDYITRGDINSFDSYQASMLIAEVEPFEDCIPLVPVKLRIKRVLAGGTPDYLTTLWFFDPSNSDPPMMYAGKTYIMGIESTAPHPDMPEISSVFKPAVSTSTRQINASGALLEDDIEIDTAWDEVTEGFYETSRGKRWLALGEIFGREYFLIPVTPTRSTLLLMPFYNGEAFITEGRDITEDEYRAGEKVCLVPRVFAGRNGLTVGSALPLPLYYARYSGAAKQLYLLGGSYLNAKGEAFQVFETGDYTVVGIYDLIKPNDQNYLYSGYEMIRNEVVIPSASVKNSDENNIVGFGPMMGYTTSFQIANGDIERYMAAWDALGISELEIQFFDRGYSNLKAGMENMRSMAFILLVSGVAATILNLLFFCNLFISKQKKRTAIERSLGTGKSHCVLSLLSGIMALVIIGAILGSASGWLLTGWAAENIGQETYSTMFSPWAVNTSDNEGIELFTDRTSAVIPLVAGGAVILVSLTIALVSIRFNLRSEPLKLLSSRV